LGGMETYWGVFLGATILTLLPEVFRFVEEYYLFLYGVIFMVLMICRPAGIMGRGTMNELGKTVWRLGRSCLLVFGMASKGSTKTRPTSSEVIEE
jgi:branched-chain amino acid transport system permease protein